MAKLSVKRDDKVILYQVNDKKYKMPYSERNLQAIVVSFMLDNDNFGNSGEMNHKTKKRAKHDRYGL